MVVKRACKLYLEGCGIRTLTKPLGDKMKRAMRRLERKNKIIAENEAATGEYFERIVRKPGTPKTRIRERGPRDLYDIPPREVLHVALRLAEEKNLKIRSDEHYRAVIEFYKQKLLTEKSRQAIRSVLVLYEKSRLRLN